MQTAAAGTAVSGTILIQREDAFIATEGQDASWTLGNQSLAYTVGFDESGRLIARDLTHGAAVTWNVARQPDTVFEVDGRALTLSRAEVGGFTLSRIETRQSSAGLELRLSFSNGRDGVTATRVYAVYPATPAIEAWTVFEAMTPRSVALSELVPLQLVVDGSGVTWTRGQDVSEDDGGPFTIERHTLLNGEHVTLESTGRSTQSALPVFAMRASQGTFFGGLVWSGSWQIDLIGQARLRAEATIGLGDTATRVSTDHPVELPHAFFGVVPGDIAAVAPALNRFIVTAIREGRPFSPQVTYNGWFVTGTTINRTIIERQMQAAASVGAEVFEVDAGWYTGAGEQDAFDFSSGLGAWTVDTNKFPDGLRPIGDIARGLGMKFGVWAEPERVDLRLVGAEGMPREEWLAQEDGHYQPGVPNEEARTALIDLGVPDAREWVLAKLTTLIEEQGIDYLKWDNNFWINNTRVRAGRGARDGNFEHVRGLYLVLAALKARFPDLTIENCSGGGNRLDLALMRYTDVGWMDDRTSPSSHVRHNLQGLTTFLPPAYLLSYLIGHADEPMHESPDMKLYARSRMPGVFGLSLQAAELDEGDTNAIRNETDVWKAYRDFGRSASAALLTDQAEGPSTPPWDALVLVSPVGDQALVYAFQNDPGTESTTIVLHGLVPASTYQLRSLENGAIGVATGSALMTTGLALVSSPDSASQLLELIAVPADADINP